MNPPSRQAYIPTLDGWRAIAISLVIGAHSVAALTGAGNRFASRLAAWLSHVSFGVDIFFALSGYLICTLLLQERVRNGSIDLARFYIRRAFRILPPILVFLAVLAILAGTKTLPEVTGAEILAVLAFVRNYVPGSTYTGHFWSLAVEEHFYLFVPLLLARLRWGAALAAAMSVALASVLIRALEYRSATALSPQYFRTECRLDALMYGAALAILLQQAPIRAWFKRHLTVFAMIGLVAFTAAALSLAPVYAQALRRSVIAFALPLFVVYTVLNPAGMAGRLLEWSWLRWLGRLSYSLYIWQELFLVHTGTPLGALQRDPWALMAALSCAVGSYYSIEKPMIRMGHRLAGSGNPTFPSSARRAAVPPGTAAIDSA